MTNFRDSEKLLKTCHTENSHCNSPRLEKRTEDANGIARGVDTVQTASFHMSYMSFHTYGSELFAKIYLLPYLDLVVSMTIASAIIWHRNLISYIFKYFHGSKFASRLTQAQG